MENYVWLILILLVITLFVYFSSRKNGAKDIDPSQRIEKDARRFAWLLMSEIKLYNEYKLSRGLANNNLYESLQDEIEDARKLYQKRVSQKDLAIYFDEAVVEVLADGDISKMGKGFALPEKTG